MTTNFRSCLAFVPLKHDKSIQNNAGKWKRGECDEVTEGSSFLSEGFRNSGILEEIDQIDPISRLPLGAYQYTFTRQNVRISYNIDSLVMYFISSGNFAEPTSRSTVTDEEIQEIEALAKLNFPHLPSLTKAKQDIAHYQEQAIMTCALEAIERCCAEVAGELRRITESPASEENQIELVTQLYPQFSDYFEQMSQIDPRFAGYALKHYVNLVIGPPNRCVKNISGLQSQIVEFLKAHNYVPVHGRATSEEMHASFSNLALSEIAYTELSSRGPSLELNEVEDKESDYSINR